MLSDLDLLEIEIDTIWLKDDRYRLVNDRGPNARPAPHLVIGASTDGRIVAIGSDVPEALAIELRAAIEGLITDPWATNA